MIVFWDVDTQKDFIYKDGALSVPQAEEIIPLIQKIRDFAVENNIKVVASADAHTDDDLELEKNGGKFPDHCMVGTDGQKKIKESIIKGNMVVPNKRLSDDLLQEIADAPQIVIEKQTLDVFDNPNTEKILEILDVKEAFVYGVATEYCVLRAVMGLLRKGVKVFVLRDCIRSVDINEGDGERALKEMVDKGAALITVDEAIEKIRAEFTNEEGD